MKTKDLNNNKSTTGITDHFKGQSKVGIKDIKEYFRKTVPGIQDNAIYARIHELKKMGNPHQSECWNKFSSRRYDSFCIIK